MSEPAKFIKRQRILAEFGDFVLDHENLDEILTEGCRLVADALDADLAKVMEIDFGKNEALVRAGVGWKPGIVGCERIVLNGRSSEAYAIDKTEPIITNDIARETRFEFPSFLQNHGVIALVNVPILLPGRKPYGVLQVDARERRMFDQEDIEFLKTYAMVLGPVVDRLKTTAELKATDQRLRLIVENARAYVMVVSDADDRITDWLGGSEEILGWSASEAIGEPTDMIFTDEDRAAGVPDRELSGACENGQASNVRWHRKKDGSRVFLDGQTIALEDQGGQLRGYFKLGQDVTDRKRAEERQHFLFALSDALRSLSTVSEIVALATARLGTHLDADRVVYGEIVGSTLNVKHDCARGVPSIVGEHSLEALGIEFLTAYQAGALVEVSDIEADPRLSEAARTTLRARQTAAFADLVLLDHSRAVSILGVQSATPRAWSAMDEAFIREAGERVRSAIERARAEAKRRESEHQLAAIFEKASVGLSELSLDGRFLRANDELCRILGRPRDEVIGLSIPDVTFPDDLQSSVDVVEHTAATGEPGSVDKRYVRPDDSMVWANSSISLLRDHAGRPRSFLVVTADLTARHEAQTALRESEERSRAILASALDYAIFTTDAEGCIETWSPGAEAVFGWTAEEAVGKNAEITFVAEDRDRGVPLKERAEAREHGYAPNVRWHRRKDGRRVFIEGSMRPMGTHEGEPQRFLKVGQDVTTRKQWDERQQVLVGELQHRTRNLIALVRSMADKTMRRATSFADFRENFRDRLEALARVQGLLSRLEEHDRVTFDELIRTELTALGALDGAAERVTLEGPDNVRLRSSTVQTLAMALHELATNAVKYGALGQPQAHLAISWHFESDGEDDKPWLHIDWRESDVEMPEPGSAPHGTGQGRELIERALPYQLKAKTRYNLLPDGVHCAISIPVSASTSDGDHHG